MSGKQRGPVARMLDYAGRRKPLTLIGCLLSALNAVLAVAPLVCIWFVLRDLVSVAPDWGAASGIERWGWLAFAFAAAGVVVYFCALVCTHLAAFRAAANMRKRSLDHLAKVPLGYYDTHASGEISRVIDGCAAQTEGVLAHTLPDFVGSLVSPVALLAVMFTVDWVLGAVCLIPVAISFLCMWLLMGGGRGGESDYMQFMMKYQDALTRMNKAATEYVRGIPVVKMFQQTVNSFRAFKQAIDGYTEFASKYVLLCEKPRLAQLVAINATFAVLVPAGILLASSAGDFSMFLTDFLFFVIFSALTTSMMNKVMYASEAVTMGSDAIRRIEELLSVPEVRSTGDGRPGHFDVELRDVSFSYPNSDRKAVDHVTLSIPEGSTVALVGPSGGGKTTIASLVPHFWDVDEGSVAIGGINVRDMEQSTVMDLVAFVFQNEHLFKESLLDNVRSSCPDASQAEVEEAIKAARCEDIVAKMPHGLKTVVGSDGVYLSGGERQRIALARAILKNAPIVVLDEATAFADPENESLIQEALSKLTRGKTVLMIAHRLSTVVGADEICVVDRGRIVEHGCHDALVNAGGVYSGMWDDYQKSTSWKIERGDA